MVRAHAVLRCAIFATVALILLGGCTPEKARALRIAATQFDIEAQAAIKLVTEMPLKEIEEPALSETQAAERFVANMMARRAAPDQNAIDRAVRGGAPQLSPAALKSVSDLRDDLITPYATFASIFERLEAGSYLAANAVRDARDPGRKLTAQLVVLAKQIEQHPPTLVARRNQFYADVMNLTDPATRPSGMSDEQRRSRLRDLYVERNRIATEEQELKTAIIKQCLKAATLGRQIDGMMAQYDQISLDDLNGIIAASLRAAGSITGKNYAEAQDDVDRFFNGIRADPVWSSVVSQALQSVNKNLPRNHAASGS